MSAVLPPPPLRLNRHANQSNVTYYGPRCAMAKTMAGPPGCSAATVTDSSTRYWGPHQSSFPTSSASSRQPDQQCSNGKRQREQLLVWSDSEDDDYTEYVESKKQCTRVTKDVEVEPTTTTTTTTTTGYSKATIVLPKQKTWETPELVDNTEEQVPSVISPYAVQPVSGLESHEPVVVAEDETEVVEGEPEVVRQKTVVPKIQEYNPNIQSTYIAEEHLNEDEEEEEEEMEMETEWKGHWVVQHGEKLLRMMGSKWAGGALGRRGTGIRAPVAPDLTRQGVRKKYRPGLGYYGAEQHDELLPELCLFKAIRHGEEMKQQQAKQQERQRELKKAAVDLTED